MTFDPAALATDLAAGYRALADLIDANPDLAAHMRYIPKNILVPVSGEDDPRAIIAAFARTGLRHGATVEKWIRGSNSGVAIAWGQINLDVYAGRDEVCERVVTGVETVTKTVPDPEALAAVPTVEVTEQVEQVEWRCRPLLATEVAE
ncbi:hypothetical protein [Actinophytocola sediminis]